MGGVATYGANKYPVAVAVTPNATAHTKGAWAELTAATSTDSHRIIIYPGSTSTSGFDTSALLDIGVGAAGAEVVVAANLAIGYYAPASGSYPYGLRFDLPLWIPKGTRVAARSQSARASAAAVNIQTIFMTEHAAGQVVRPAAAVLTFGADTATSHGVAIVPAAAAAKGAWSQITAATTEPLSALALGVQGNAINSMQAGTVALDIGVGAAGSEVVVVSDVPAEINNSEWVARGGPVQTWNVDIPAGTRIAVRCSNSGGSSSVYYVDAIVYGIRRTA